jgi:site-specific DNA-cytosine methylase
MDAISLFSGAGGDSLGLKQAGLNVVAFSEFNKDAIQTHLSAFPNSVLLGSSVKGDITKIPDAEFEPYRGKIKVVFAGFPCFIAGTLVLTDTGYKAIEDVSLYDKLLTHTNTFQQIVNLQQKVYSDNLFTIKIKYHHRPIKCTEEHPFYIRTKVKIWNNDTRSYTVSFKEPEWKNAKDLTLNDYFGMTVNTKNVIPTFQYEKVVNKSLITLETVKVETEDEWFMLGYFVGDGWIEEGKKFDGRLKYTIRFAINNRDEEYIGGRLRNVLPITNKKVDTGLCKKFGCQSLKWYTILSEFGKYAHGKKIPEWVQDAPKHLVQEFINGYMAADGSVSKTGVHKITTVSYNLALGLQRLHLKLGHIFGINKTIRPKTCVIEGRTVNQRDTYTISGRIQEKPRYTSFIQGDYAWLAPVSIYHNSVEDILVYNFEVENDNSYIVENTIVHNCQGFSNAGKKDENDPRNKMFYQFLRVVNIIQPEWVMGENVAGLLTRKTDDGKTKVIDVIKTEFAGINYSLSSKVYDVSTAGVSQSRKRLFMIGNKLGIPFEMPEFSFPKQGIRKYIASTLEGAIETTLSPPPECVFQIPELTPTGTPHPFLVLKHPHLISFGKRVSPHHSEVLDLDKPCKTVICAYTFQPRLYVCLITPSGKKFIRCLVTSELAQIQGFPHNHPFKGNTNSIIKQIGNAVPAKIIELLTKSILETEEAN